MLDDFQINDFSTPSTKPSSGKAITISGDDDQSKEDVQIHTNRSDGEPFNNSRGFDEDYLEDVIEDDNLKEDFSESDEIDIESELDDFDDIDEPTIDRQSKSSVTDNTANVSDDDIDDMLHNASISAKTIVKE